MAKEGDFLNITAEQDETIEIMRAKSNPAAFMKERMSKAMLAFQNNLGAEQELGVSIVGGGVPPFHLRALGVSDPDILSYSGIDPDGNMIQVLQHHSQLSIVLVAVGKLDEEPFRFGAQGCPLGLLRG